MLAIKAFGQNPQPRDNESFKSSTLSVTTKALAMEALCKIFDLVKHFSLYTLMNVLIAPFTLATICISKFISIIVFLTKSFAGPVLINLITYSILFYIQTK